MQHFSVSQADICLHSNIFRVPPGIVLPSQLATLLAIYQLVIGNVRPILPNCSTCLGSDWTCIAGIKHGFQIDELVLHSSQPLIDLEFHRIILLFCNEVVSFSIKVQTLSLKQESIVQVTFFEKGMKIAYQLLIPKFEIVSFSNKK